MQAVDFERLERLAERERKAFARADPFPHVVLDDSRRGASPSTARSRPRSTPRAPRT